MDALKEDLPISVRRHLSVRQQAALHDVVFLAPVKEGFGADGVRVKGQRRFAGLGPADEAGVPVALELDFMITLGFLCLKVNAKLVECLVPDQSLRENVGGDGPRIGVNRGGRKKSGSHL